MKDKLKDKIITEGTLAEELVKTEGYQYIAKTMTEKRELLLKEALNSKSLEELGYARGFYEGLGFFENSVVTMIRQRENLKKHN
ncbi:MAG: hypothetical protein BWY19_01049 [bacterium ADurb.Bin212]|jgi:hypothetical protein|nr:MAG: hypothetical protein BWY19_01049 [bacterium ADurb.Bin212]